MIIMKKFLYTLAVLVGAWAMTACSDETYEGANGRIPLADDIDAVITVDQTTNQVTFKLNNPGCYPIWKIEKSAGKYTQSTVNGYKDIVTLAGTYNVEVQMGNRNGICQGSKTMTFTIDNSIVDWTPYMTFLCGDGNKRWEMAYTQAGHLGCGESGTDGLGWWSAAPNDKAGTGMYETLLEFGNTGAAPSGSYKLDPGTEGMIYANKDVTLEPYASSNPNDGNDFSVPFTLRESTFTFTMEGTDLYLELPAGQTLNYVANDDIVNAPRFRVLSLNRNEIQLVSDNGGIAWHYTYVPEGSQAGSGEEKFEGYDYANENNLYRLAQPELLSTWTADDNWAEIEGPEVEINPDLYTITYNVAPGSSQWQAQVHVGLPGLVTKADTTYDISIIVESEGGDIGGATFKFTDAEDDNNFLIAEREAVPGYEQYVFHREEVAGIDCSNYKLAMDFSGAPVGTIKIKNIVIIEHSLNPGPFPGGSGEPEQPVTWVDEASADNLWRTVEPTMEFWWANNDWAQIATPDFLAEDYVYTLNVTEAPGGSQWQAQTKFNTTVALTEDQNYDFKVVIYATNDIPGTTIKLTSVTDDTTFLTADRHDVLGYEDNVFTFVNMPGKNINDFQLCFDFAGCGAPTDIKISGIILQTHRD